MSPWSQVEIDFLTANYGPMNAREIAKQLNRSRIAVHSMRKRLMLNMTIDQRSRACSEQHVCQRGDLNNNWKGGISANRYIYTKRYRKSNPEIAIAHAKVKRAIKCGKLIRKPCEACGSEQVQAHHDDYSRPLDVRWLCKIHHIDADNARRRKESERESEAA